MIVRIITVKVTAGREADFESATVKNHEGSIHEPGVLRFDVLRDNDTPGTYYLYEAYRDEAATVAHKETEHYRRWKADVEPLLAGARSAIACTPVAPVSLDAW